MFGIFKARPRYLMDLHQVKKFLLRPANDGLTYKSRCGYCLKGNFVETVIGWDHVESYNDAHDEIFKRFNLATVQYIRLGTILDIGEAMHIGELSGEPCPQAAKLYVIDELRKIGLAEPEPSVEPEVAAQVFIESQVKELIKNGW